MFHILTNEFMHIFKNFLFFLNNYSQILYTLHTAILPFFTYINCILVILYNIDNIWKVGFLHIHA